MATGPTTDPALQSPAYELAIASFVAFNILSLIGNSLILKVVPKIPSDAMFDSTKVCLMGQAVTDAVFAFMSVSNLVTELIGESTGWTTGREPLCRAFGFVVSSLTGASIWNVTLLNTERYLFIARPMLYRRIATRNLTLSAYVVFAIVNLALTLLFVFINDESLYIIRIESFKVCVIDLRDPSFLPYTFCIFVHLWVITVCLVIQYVHIIKISVNHLNRIQPRLNQIHRPAVIDVMSATTSKEGVQNGVGDGIEESACCSSQEPPPTTMNAAERSGEPRSQAEAPPLLKNLRILRTPFIIMCCFFCSYLPLSFMSVYVAFTGNNINNLVYAFCSMLVTFNGGMNIVVYYFTIQPFRQVLKNTLLCR
nr:G-protein coupled receptor 84-like [Lytechinus pictus]